MSGTIAVHHVELCKNPVSVLPTDKQIFFDEGNRELVTLTSKGEVCRAPIEGEDRGKREYYTCNRQGITNAKFSPDHKYLAVQFSPVDIEFSNLEDSTSWVQSFKTKKSKGTILGFFWTYADYFLVIMTGSIDLYQFPKPPKGNGMKLVAEHQKVVAGWFHYSARHRIALIANPPPISANPPNSNSNSTLSVHTFYFKLNKIIKMPRFEVDSDGPLSPQELVIHQLYDAIYCIHVHSHRKELVLYQLTKETVIKRVRLDLLTAGTSYIHIVDNLLLVHNNSSRVTMMFDIKSKKDLGGFPVASPLPISPIPYEPPSDANFLAEPLLPPTMDSRSPIIPHTTSMNPLLYSDSWSFHLPCYIVDKNAGYCWNVGLNLDGIVQSLTNDRCRMTEFLLRRTLPRTKKVLLRELLAMVVEHESLAVAALVFDSINGVLAALLREGLLDASSSSPHIHSKYTNAGAIAKAGAQAVGGSSGPPGGKGQSTDSERLEPDWTVDPAETFEQPDSEDLSSSTNSVVAAAHATPHSHTQPHAHQPSASIRAGESVVAITQADMYTHVFVPIEGRDPPLLDSKYVVGVITEYIRSLNFHHVAVTPFLYELLINFLVSNSRWYQLHQFLQYHVVSDSMHVACQLLSLESKYPPAYQLALDMMKRLNTHEQIVEVLISKNLLLPALRFMKSHRVKIPPRRILEAAVQLRDPTLIFHVYKFFEARKELPEDGDKYVLYARKLFSDITLRSSR